jgi:hypothetical protein
MIGRFRMSIAIFRAWPLLQISNQEKRMAIRPNNRSIISMAIMIVTMITLAASVAGAYEHLTAHRRLNELSFKQFLTMYLDKRYAKTDVYQHYIFTQDPLPITGYTIKARANFVYEEKLIQGDLAWWIREGGWTADEPEILSSLRHFYDPFQSAYDKNTQKKVCYLTDHVDESIGRIVQLLGATTQKNLVFLDPRMDAREWAIYGPARQLHAENKYSWKKGVEYMRAAFQSRDENQKEILFSAAWRALGETMHLVSDMTVPAHVRNDAHPAKMEVFTGYRADPYEYFMVDNSKTYGDNVAWAAQHTITRQMDEAIDRQKNPMALFDFIARNTNSTFFSADTISGFHPITKKWISNANGMPGYKNPKLDRMEHDDVLNVFTKGGYLMAHEEWLENTWWNLDNAVRQKIGRPGDTTYEEIARSQGSVLIPIAMRANMKLIEWFLPKLKINMTGFDSDTRRATGMIVHKDDGAYADKTLGAAGPLVYNKGSKKWSKIYLNNRPYFESRDDYALNIVNNKIALTLGNQMNLVDGQPYTATLQIYFGGFWVQSDPFYFKVHPKDATTTAMRLSWSGKEGVYMVFDPKQTAKYSTYDYGLDGYSTPAEISANCSVTLTGDTILKTERPNEKMLRLTLNTTKPLRLKIQAKADLKIKPEQLTAEWDSNRAVYHFKPSLKGYLLKGLGETDNGDPKIYSSSGEFTTGRFNRSSSVSIYALIQEKGHAVFRGRRQTPRDPVTLQANQNQYTQICIGVIDIRTGGGMPSGVNPYGN